MNRHISTLVGSALLVIALLFSSGLIISSTKETSLIYNLATAINGRSQLALISGAGSNLVGHYTFDEGTGTTVADSAGSNTGTVMNGATWLTTPNAKIGNGAMNFDGVNDYVSNTVTNTTQLLYKEGNATTRSVAFWVKAPGVATLKCIYCEGSNGASNARFQIGSHASGDPVGTLSIWLRNDSASSPVDQKRSLGVALDDTWHHVVWTDNAGTAKLYIDGVQDAQNFNYTPTGTYTLDRSSIGAQSKDIVQFFPGTVDDLRLYNRVLSPADIAELYAYVGGGAPPDPTPGDSAAPVISSIQSSSITSSGVAITWNTDETSDTQVEYSTDTSYGSQTTLSTPLINTHSVSITGLSASTAYHFRVKSRDASGNLATSADQTFSTSASVPTTYAISVSKSGAGTGTVSGGSISCGSTCSQSGITVGSPITLTASAGSGSIFSGWSGSCTGTGTCVVSNTATVTATFTVGVQTTTIISPDHRIDWQAGIPGGIPTYPLCNTSQTIPGAVGNGIADDWQAITNAMAACSPGTALFIPEGTYKLSKALVIKKGKALALRGAGPTKTKLISYNTDSANRGAIVISEGSGNGVTTGITGGMNKDSTVVTVQNAASFNVGDYVRISQQNDPAVIQGTLPSSNPYQGQFNQITAKNVSTNTLTLARPLYYTYNPTYTPVMYQSLNQTVGSGVEDLQVEMRGTVDNNIFIFLASRAWVKNVESYNSNYSHIALNNCYQCEVRDSNIHRHLTYDSNTRYAVQLGDFTSDSLVENNIVDAGNLAIAIQNAATGNVVAYNYSLRGYGNGYPNGNTLAGLLAVHGGNANMNLIEGNVVPAIGVDNFWGSSINNVFFRNYVRRYSLTNESNVPAVYALIAVWNDALNYYMSYVGNVLGRPQDAGDTNTSHAIWYFGRDRSRLSTKDNYANPLSAIDDPFALQSSTLHGNFDYVSGSTQWDAGISNHTLPASLYLGSKPSWFGSVSWPPIGPDVSGYTNKIPAEICYEQGLMPNCLVSGGGGTPPAGPTNLAPVVSAGLDRSIELPTTSVSLLGTATDDGLPALSTLSSTWTKISGPGTVTFTNSALPSTSVTITQAGTYVLRLTATDGTLTSTDDVSVVVGGDITAPVRSAGAPASTLAYTVTSTTVSLTTNELATCFWSNLPNTAIALMNNSFAQTSSLTHTYALSALTPATAFNFYVRCRDAAGNANTNDYTISFSVAATPASPGTDADLDTIADASDLCPNTPPTLRSSVNAQGCPKPLATSFDIKPNFHELNLQSVPSLEIGISTYGKVQFNTTIPLIRSTTTVAAGTYKDRLDLDSGLTLGTQSIALNTSILPELNLPAQVTLYNVSYITPKVLKDGVVCTTCNKVSYTSNTYVFTVTGFSAYTLTEGAVTPPPAGGGTTSGGAAGGGGIIPLPGTSGANATSSSPVLNTVILLTQNLSRGMTHAEVSILQSFLKARGYLIVNAVTRFFGPATEKAVKSFQTKNKIVPVTGVVGPKTRAVINPLLSTSTLPVITPPAVSYTITRVLSKGMTHKEVTILQNFLIAKGYLKSKATGYFGLQTEAAVKVFQTKNKIVPATGIVGPKTRGIIK